MSYPGSNVYPGSATFPASVTRAGVGARVVRELAPLRVMAVAATPDGGRHRWAGDDPDPANRIRGLQWSSQMPGGWEEMSCVLPRQPGHDYSDLARLSTVQLLAAGGEVVGEFRLERAPRVSGDQMSVSPAARGWQAHLEDDKSVTAVFIDRDLGRWHGPTAERRLGLLNLGFPVQNDPSQGWDPRAPALTLSVQGRWDGPTPRAESWYDAGSNVRIAGVYASWEGWADSNFQLYAVVANGTGTGPATEASPNLYPATRGTVNFGPRARYRYAHFLWRYALTQGGSEGGQYDVKLAGIYVLGAYGVPVQGVGEAAGFLASDMVAYVVSRWAPLLSFSKGANGTVLPSGFVVPQAAFHDPTTVASIIDEVNRYELFDWAVWDDRTFHFHPRGARGRRWKARVGPAGLEETGPQADRVWNGVIVTYQDVDGSTRTAGPPGSGSDTESPLLLDTDPANPANQLNMRRWEVLQMGMVSTPQGAAAAGSRFLLEARQLDMSGRARLVGYVEDEYGTQWPYYHVRAGDTIEFVDAADRRPRRIVRASYDADARAVSVDLDSPPEGLQALLGRMQMSLSPYGM